MKSLIRFVFAGLVIVVHFACASHNKVKDTQAVVAIVDTGFDTHHPALQVPIVDSYDFSRGTKDVGPYIFWKYGAKGSNSRAESLVQLAPELKTWFPLNRDILGEFKSAAFHGTAVASLALYDLQPFTLLYKVYPIPENVDPDEWMTKSVLSAIQRAVAHRARIVNLSLGFTFENGTSKSAQHMKLKEMIATIIRENPNVLFVAAAGNENRMINNTTISGYPCGLSLENVICVGAVDHSGKLWKPSATKGTNDVEIAGATMVYSYGDRVFSAVPQNMCVTKAAMKALFSEETLDNALAENLLNICKSGSGYAEGEATSIATPLVTHRALEILTSQPTISAKGLKEEILKTTRTSAVDSEIRYIEPRRPSWASK